MIVIIHIIGIIVFISSTVKNCRAFLKILPTKLQKSPEIILNMLNISLIDTT